MHLSARLSGHALACSHLNSVWLYYGSSHFLYSRNLPETFRKRGKWWHSKRTRSKLFAAEPRIWDRRENRRRGLCQREESLLHRQRKRSCRQNCQQKRGTNYNSGKALIPLYLSQDSVNNDLKICNTCTAKFQFSECFVISRGAYVQSHNFVGRELKAQAISLIYWRFDLGRISSEP